MWPILPSRIGISFLPNYVRPLNLVQLTWVKIIIMYIANFDTKQAELLLSSRISPSC